MLKADGEHVLTECPVGMILRETPHIYELIDYLASFEHATPSEVERSSRYTLQAWRLYRSEQSRLQELRRHNKEVTGDAQYGSRVLRGRS